MSEPDRKSYAHLQTLEQVCDEHIRKVLKEVGGNKTLAARILDVDRRTLLRRGYARGASTR